MTRDIDIDIGRNQFNFIEDKKINFKDNFDVYNG